MSRQIMRDHSICFGECNNFATILSIGVFGISGSFQRLHFRTNRLSKNKTGGGEITPSHKGGLQRPGPEVPGPDRDPRRGAGPGRAAAAQYFVYILYIL